MNEVSGQPVIWVRKTVDLCVQLRGRQLHYLDYLSERDGISRSAALSAIIRDATKDDPAVWKRADGKTRMHFTLPPEIAASLNRRAQISGEQVFPLVRLLIDEAAKRDPVLGGIR